MPARLRLSCGMKTWKLFLLSVLESLEFGWQAIRYALVLVSAFFRQRASLGCDMVAMQIPNLVDLPAQSPRSVLGHGLLHGAYGSLSNPVHLCDLASFPSPGCAFCCDGASDDGLGDPATAGSNAFRSTAQLSVPRQRRNLRRRGEPVSRGNWDCRSQNGPPVPLAKSIRGKVWRHPTARVVGSRGGP